MKKLLILLLVFLSMAEIRAQVPGYRGKKFMLGYSVQMAPNVWNWTNNLFIAPIRLHPKHIFSAQYISGRHTILALEGGFMQYKRTLYNYNTGKFGSAKLNGSFIGANVMMFGNNLAPVGNYFSLNVQQAFMNFNDDKGYTYQLDDVNNQPVEGRFQTTIFGIGFGTKRVYANTIVADMEIGLGGSITSFKEGNLLLYSNSQSYVKEFMLFRHLLNYKLGISGLLF